MDVAAFMARYEYENLRSVLAFGDRDACDANRRLAWGMSVSFGGFFLPALEFLMPAPILAHSFRRLRQKSGDEFQNDSIFGSRWAQQASYLSLRNRGISQRAIVAPGEPGVPWGRQMGMELALHLSAYNPSVRMIVG